MRKRTEAECYLLATLKTADVALKEAGYELEAADKYDPYTFPVRVVVQEAIKKLEEGFLYDNKGNKGGTALHPHGGTRI